MVSELVGKARRRILWNEMLAQGVWALCGCMAAVIVLLLLGTQILDWHWLVMLPAATLAAGLYRTWRRIPSPYSVAQLIDRRLRLADSVSTAVYFGLPEARGRISDELRQAQRAQADSVSRHARAAEAVPFAMPRAVYALGALLVTASSLFALRYGLDRRLELKKPLARIIQQALGVEQQQVAALEKKRPPTPKSRDLEDMNGAALPENQETEKGQAGNASGQSLDKSESGPPKQDPATVRSQDAASREEPGEEGDGLENLPGVNTGAQQGENGQKGRSAQGKPQQGKQDSPSATGNNSSLMAKFQEAMQNLLSRMRQPGSGQASQQSARAQNGQQGKPQRGGSQAGEQGRQGAGEQSQEGGSGDQGQMAQSGAGRGSGEGQEASSKQPSSGVGRQDGSKDLKTAEQLAAMGKISEIIGKRSANVSGEATVEVQSGSQQLRTPYSRRSADHNETTAEINRDEVPMALQPYVQQYFEQVRRQAPAKAATQPQ